MYLHRISESAGWFSESTHCFSAFVVLNLVLVFGKATPVKNEEVTKAAAWGIQSLTAVLLVRVDPSRTGTGLCMADPNFMGPDCR